MKRHSVALESTKFTKYTLQDIEGRGVTITPKKEPLEIPISLPPNTIIQARNAINTQQHSNGIITNNLPRTINLQNRPTFFLKREIPKRTIRTITLEMIEKNPLLHLGIEPSRLSLIKNITCSIADISLIDCYLTLKKLRQNEDFPLLAEYFEVTDVEAQQIFRRTVVKLASYLQFLISWPTNGDHYDRHKNKPFTFRSSLSNVHSMLECVETDMVCPSHFDCRNYKFILSISPNSLITYISDAYMGHYDDLSIFKASNFNEIIPNYLKLFAEPGKGIIHRKSKLVRSGRENVSNFYPNEMDSNIDSANESTDDIETDNDDERLISRYSTTKTSAAFASHQTLVVVNKELTSTKVKDFSIPTIERVPVQVCRRQINQVLFNLREFKILQPYAIKEMDIFQYLNEVLITVAALVNLRQ